MIPLGFFSVCLQAAQLKKTVSYYKTLGFIPVGEDAPGLRESLQYGSQTLTFMSFLQNNLINLRGADIHQLKLGMRKVGIPITVFENVESEERLMLDDEGNPQPDNECGSFSIGDPDGHEIFFNTHREEREPFEKAVRTSSSTALETPWAKHLSRDLNYCLEISDLTASQRFYETLGLTVVRRGETASVYTPTHYGNAQFVFQLRLGDPKNVVVQLTRSKIDAERLEALGMEPADGPDVAWCGNDPDGRSLEIRNDTDDAI